MRLTRHFWNSLDSSLLSSAGKSFIKASPDVSATTAVCGSPSVKPTGGRLLFSPPNGLISYQQAGVIQEYYVRRWLDFKAGKLFNTDGKLSASPEPVLLAFEMNPVYTAGRRQIGKLSEIEIEHFKCDGHAEFVESRRGGQTTFHGPGQLVVYPILDLRQLGISVKCYVRLLENSIIETLQTYGIKSFITKDTGVWVSDMNKVAAIGIHVRRNITSHGLALNISTDPFWFDRIIACGLPDKNTISMAQMGVNVGVQQVSQTLAGRISANLNLRLEQMSIQLPTL